MFNGLLKYVDSADVSVPFSSLNRTWSYFDTDLEW